MKTTFPKHIVKIKNNYVCTCGHKFSRELSDWFTMNPFNNTSEVDNRRYIADILMKTTKDCPKCKTTCKPK